MLITVDLDDEPVPVADEVTDVAPERLLTAPPTREVAPDAIPENQFGVRHLGSKLLRAPLDEGMTRESRHASDRARPDLSDQEVCTT
jgi:hypothetical protein